MMQVRRFVLTKWKAISVPSGVDSRSQARGTQRRQTCVNAVEEVDATEFHITAEVHVPAHSPCHGACFSHVPVTRGGVGPAERTDREGGVHACTSDWAGGPAVQQWRGGSRREDRRETDAEVRNHGSGRRTGGLELTEEGCGVRTRGRPLAAAPGAGRPGALHRRVRPQLSAHDACRPRQRLPPPALPYVHTVARLRCDLHCRTSGSLRATPEFAAEADGSGSRRARSTANDPSGRHRPMVAPSKNNNVLQPPLDRTGSGCMDQALQLMGRLS